MKINPKKESFNNRNIIGILIAGLMISNILAIFVMPFIVFKYLYHATMPLNYSIAALLSVAFICTLGFTLGNQYTKINNKLVKYSKEIEHKNSALEHMFEDLKTSKENLSKFSKTLEKKVFEKTEAIQNLLDNAGQGFLTFSTDLIVDKEYSLECIRIFNRGIQDANISELLFPGNNEQQELFKAVTTQVLAEQELSKREAYLSLLPHEATINNKQIQLDYKIISRSIYEETESVMLILTDITETCMLQAQMEEEKNVLKTVVNIVTNYSDFMYCIRDYNNFCKNKIFEIINTSFSIKDIIVKLYRSIHTFKGSFSQFGLNNVTANLHQFEFELSELMKGTNNMSLEDLEIFLLNFDLYEWLDEDLRILKSILGDSFFKDNEVLEIDKQNFIELENKMLSVMSPLDFSLLIPDVRKFRYKPFRDLLKSYTTYVLGLSDRFCKQINPLIIEGGEFLVDPEMYSPFTKSLGHVFRDIMEYGIEPFDERIDSDKSELGNITCRADLVDNIIKLSITDDGYGIDIDLIRKTAVEKGFYTNEDIMDKKDDELLALIFSDGFSTNSEVSELSGRGMGLSAVKDEVDKAGGTIEISTKHGLGTNFTFFIPLKSCTDLPQISEIEFMNTLIDTTKEFFEGQVSLSDAGVGKRVKKVDTLSLRDVSVIIGIKGAINGIFFFTADESLLKSILSHFIFDSSYEEEISTEDLLAECTNMIMGNFPKSIPHIEDHITLGTPITLHSIETKMTRSSDGIWTAFLESDKGNIEINYIK